VTEEKEQYTLPEAPASINVRFYYHRFDVQATVRDETLAGAWDKVTWLIEKKLIPHPKVQPKFGNNSASLPKPKAEEKPKKVKAEPKEFSEDDPPSAIMCPEHGVEMELKDGKWGPYYSHKIAEGKWCNLKVEKARKDGVI